MNYHFVLRQLGKLMSALSLCMLSVLLWSVIDSIWYPQIEAPAIEALSLSIALSGTIGGSLWILGRRKMDEFLGRREALLLVGTTWLLGAVVCALPYWFWARFGGEFKETHIFHAFASCYFESMSGLTTTGSTVLTDVEAVPRGLLLWRSMTHWLGGLGIVVLFVAVLPTLGVGSKKLFQAEVPGPSKTGLRPRIGEAARVVLLIYLTLNVLLIACLKLAGLTWFDAVCESFGTIATGGFSTHNASIAGYRSLAAELIIIVFMFLSGVNFALYYGLVRRGWRAMLADTELRIYIATTLIAAVLVILWIAGRPLVTSTGEHLQPSWAQAIRHGLFHVMSYRTNTGYATADVNSWGVLPHILLVMFLFTGASAGSTAGGVKTIRCIVAVKLLFAAVERSFRPHVVRPIRVGHQAVDADQCLEAVVYILLYLIVWFAGTMIVQLVEPLETFGWVTAFTASAACLSNTGPGLARVGTVENYGWMTDTSKLVLSMVMLLGRLEMYALFVLFMPRFWRGE